MKKVLSIVIVFLLMFLMPMAASADFVGAGEVASDEETLKGTTSGSIRINADAGDTFYAYSVMQIKYTNASNALEYNFTSEFENYLAARDNAPKTTEEYQTLADESTEVKSVLDGYAAYCTANHIAPAYTIDPNTSITAALGQYVITGRSTVPDRIYQYMTASFPVFVVNGIYKVKTNVTIEPKYDIVSITKEIVDEDNHVAVGDTVNYSITADIPTYPENAVATTFIIGDTMSGGLALTASSIKIYYTNNGTLTGAATDIIGTNPATGWVLLSAGVDTTTEERGFTSSFTYDVIKNYARIMVRYAAVVTAEAEASVSGNDPAATNTATLKYSSDPFVSSGHDETPSIPSEPIPVYTYKLLIEKQSSENAKVKLRGVTFEIRDSADAAIYFVSKGTEGYYRRAVSSSEAGATTAVVTGENGVLSLDGLDLGTYQIKETATISGYALLAGTTSVTITDSNNDGLIDSASDGVFRQVIKNTPITTTLPQTGGMSAVLFLIIGAIFAIAGLVFVVRLEKRVSGKNR